MILQRNVKKKKKKKWRKCRTRPLSAAVVLQQRHELLHGAGGKKKKIRNAAVCRSATARHEWNQTFIFFMFAIFAVAAAASVPHGWIHSLPGYSAKYCVQTTLITCIFQQSQCSNHVNLFTPLVWGGDVAQLVEHRTGTLSTQVRFPTAARDFSFRSESTFSADSSAVSVHRPCAIACIYICAHVKDPVSISEFDGLWKR